ncbi:MAG: ABC transporter ATP-binding protein [Oscillospiraceae bacterium]|nr:ABC transporter ATP-binding protein [Oscillospiraceae bacterium]
MKNGIFKTFFTFSKGARRFFLAAIGASAVSIFFKFLTPRIIGGTVDAVLGADTGGLPAFLAAWLNTGGRLEYLAKHIGLCALLAVASAVLSGVFNFRSRVNIAKGTGKYVKALRDRLFEHTQHLPFSWHTDHLTGDIIQRCTTDVETTQNFVSTQLLEVIQTVLLLIIAFALMFSMNVPMSIVVLLFIPIIAGYTCFFFGRISRKFLECDNAEGDLMVQVQENLTGVRVVRAFGREKHEQAQFDRKNEIYTGKWISLGYTLGVYWGVGDIVCASQLLATVVAGAYMAASGRLTLGVFITFISYAQSLGGPVRQLGRILSEMSKTGVSLRRIKDILDAPAETASPEEETPDLRGDIVFDNVSFRYGDKQVLRGVSFTAKGGKTIGILGRTGSGKSTVTYLLNRLYELPEDCGTITVGGVDIRKIDRYYLRRNIGLVLQEPFLFSKTVFENIDIATDTGDLEKVRQAARAAAVDDSVMAFPKGYDTVVGEWGVTLSGGQKQRVALARTFMMGAPVMVFDDSMSNLDMKTDEQIRTSLRENAGDATVLLISHRISTLMTADWIIVLDRGAVVQQGTHEQLLAQEGIYRQTYEIQSGKGGETNG